MEKLIATYKTYMGNDQGEEGFVEDVQEALVDLGYSANHWDSEHMSFWGGNTVYNFSVKPANDGKYIIEVWEDV